MCLFSPGSVYFELREANPNVQRVPFLDIKKTQSSSLFNLLHIKHLPWNTEWQLEDKVCREMDSFSLPLPVTSDCHIQIWPQIRAQVREGLWFLGCHEQLESQMRILSLGVKLLSALPAVHCSASSGGRSAFLLHLILARLHSLRACLALPKGSWASEQIWFGLSTKQSRRANAGFSLLGSNLGHLLRMQKTWVHFCLCCATWICRFGLPLAVWGPSSPSTQAVPICLT